MKNMKLTLTAIIAVSMFCISCRSVNAGADSSVKDVPFEAAGHYFLKNDVAQMPPAAVYSAEEFERYFGMAAVMGKNGQPTEIDFGRQYVICIALPATDISTVINAVSLVDNGKGEIVLKYEVRRGAEQTYTTQPLLLLVVDKKYDGRVRLEEV